MKFRDPAYLTAKFRYAFLQYIEELAPEVDADLRRLIPLAKKVGIPLEVVARQDLLFDWAIMFDGTRDEFVQAITTISRDERIPRQGREQYFADFLSLQYGFADVCGKFGLDRGWLLFKLFEYLSVLVGDPSQRLSDQHVIEKNPFSGEDVKFTATAWYIDEDSNLYERRVKDAFKVHLNNYIRDTASAAVAAGQRRSKGRLDDVERVKWLVRWTVQRRRFREIAEEFNVSEQSIKDAFTQFEKSYDLPRRRPYKR